MKLSERIVTKIPLDSLWTEVEVLDAERKEYLNLEQIKKNLESGPIQFIVANPGDKLIWIPIENCYKFFKSYIKEHLINDPQHISLDEFKDNYGY